MSNFSNLRPVGLFEGNSRFVNMLNLDEVGVNDAPSVGEEAAALGELLRVGASVSPGFVVPISSYAEFVSSPQVRSLTEGRSSSNAGELSVRLLSAPFPKILERSLRSSYRRMSGPRDTVVFLRSEEIKIEVLGEEELLYGIKKIWADHIAHLSVLGKGPSFNRLPILVQQKEVGDVTGKLFTSDPHSGDKKTALIEVDHPDGGEKLFFEKISRSGPAEGAAEGRLVKRIVTGASTEEAQLKLLSSVLSWAGRVEMALGGPRELDWVVRRGEEKDPIFLGIRRLYLRRRVPVAAKVWIQSTHDLGSGFIPEEVAGVVVSHAGKAADLAKTAFSNPILWEMEAVHEGELAVVRRARHKDGLKNIHIVLPPVRTADGLRELKRDVAAEGLRRGPNLRLYLRAAFPANVVLLDRFLEVGLDGVILDSEAIGRGFMGTDDSVGLDDSLLWAIKEAKKVCGDAGVKFLCRVSAPSDELMNVLLDEGVRHIVVADREAEALLLALSGAEERLLAAK